MEPGDFVASDLGVQFEKSSGGRVTMRQEEHLELDTLKYSHGKPLIITCEELSVFLT